MAVWAPKLCKGRGTWPNLNSNYLCLDEGMFLNVGIAKLEVGE
jgi:hypothetical protein